MTVDPESGMTLSEKKIADLLSSAWNVWVEECEPEDIETHAMMMYINAIHNILTSRIAAREYPEYWQIV